MRFGEFQDSEYRQTVVCRHVVSLPTPSTPLEEFPSSKAVPHHCGHSLLGVYTQSVDERRHEPSYAPSDAAEACTTLQIPTRIDEAPTCCQATSPHVAECLYRSTDTSPMLKASSVQNRISKTMTAKRSRLNIKPSFSRRQVDAASPTRRTRTQPRLDPPHFRVAAARMPLLSGLPLLHFPPSRRVASTSHQEQLQWAPTFKVFLLERVRSAAIRCQMVAALSFLGFHSPPESSYHRGPHHVSW